MPEAITTASVNTAIPTVDADATTTIPAMKTAAVNK